MSRIYLDYAATTYMRPEIINAMLPYMSENYSNPSGLYFSARKAKNIVENSRAQIAEILDVKANEIFFTSGGTESNNWAILGSARLNNGKRLLISKMEHKSVLNPAKYLGSLGYHINYINSDNDGNINLNELNDSLSDDTFLISVMYANNETGTINPIKEIGEITSKNGILFHSDAVAAAPHIKLSTLNIDLMSISAHKLYGPKGIGALYIRNGCKLSPFLLGGDQESKMRAGTENVASIIGFAQALKLIDNERYDEEIRLKEIKQYLISQLKNISPKIIINGSDKNTLNNILNISLPDIDSQTSLMALDMAGIECSAGSACMGGGINKSHVLKAMGISDWRINNAIRLSFGKNTTKKEIDYLITILKQLIERVKKNA